ncbi:MAG: type III-B CRISPR module RAMP protein Cmr4 [Candidatus Omnitrophica bacterium]|nr:type III-B CRISPR module RAMP protein Cmr4 [Candidatus Omnitrophota bacterium]
MTNKASMIFIHAQTSLHPGSGTATGAIDLPVQRERHTDWPLIPGSTLKGVLRDHFRGVVARANPEKDLIWADRDAELEHLFGPSMKGRDEEAKRGSNAADFAGALAVTDARILLFPVRSLAGLFAWVTCPAALDRLRRDAQLATEKFAIPKDIPELKNNAALISSSCELLVQDRNMVLEEFDFTAQECQGLKELVDELSRQLSLDRLKTRLAVISDDMFTHFVKNATEVNARIALDYKTKTVSNGALFYVETLPPETVFYSLLIADNSKGKRDKDVKPVVSAMQNDQEVVSYVGNLLKTSPILQIGGEASTGKGICQVTMCGGGK